MTVRGQARAVIDMMKQRGAAVPIPVDVVCAKTFSVDAEATIKAADQVADDDQILDIGPQTAEQLAAILKQAGTIVWNGPVGVFEFDAFANGTKVVSQAIADGNVQAVNYFVAQKYIDALGKLASANNSKVILMPLEASQVIGAVGGIGEIVKATFDSKKT